ncbi:MAG: hypothetical protein ACI82A_002235 [Candidatus Azotimanducaceae bacterium]
MSIDIEVRKAEQVVAIRIVGQATAAELALEYVKMFDDPEFKTNMPAVWDVSGLNLTRVPLQEIRLLPGLLGQYSERRGKQYRAALVTNRMADFHLIRIYSALLKLIGSFRMRVFDNNEEAMAWLATKKDA